MRISPFFLSASLFAVVVNSVFAGDNKVIVHEWGTFTCLQDEQGNAIKGINIDDEPVPPFVYDQHAVNVIEQYSPTKRNFGLPPYANYHNKGWSPGDPQVTMRLETPVIYFYPPKDKKAEETAPLDVQVNFHDGMLSQYYPYAALGVAERSTLSAVHSFVFKAGDLAGMTSKLEWKGVQLGSSAKPVESGDKVWTTPREVSAPLLEVKAPNYTGGQVHTESQAEHFLFYRGVGHLDSPLRLIRDPYNVGEKDKFYIYPSLSKAVPLVVSEDAVFNQGWLTEIHADGSCAFQTCPQFGGVRSQSRQSPFTSVKSRFELADFSADNLTKLKVSMREALIRDGLYPDEATAMLKTWELSYFKSPGLRFFYIVPRAWVDKVLPLTITGAPTKITRVMVGRIELVTDVQKAALARLAAGPCPDLTAVKSAAEATLQDSKRPKEQMDAFYNGEKPLGELGIAIPPLVQDYLSLGRFRDALIVHEQQEHPSPALAQFIETNRLVSQQD